MWFIGAKVQGFTRLQQQMIQEVDTKTANISRISLMQLQEKCSVLVSLRTLVCIICIH